MIWLAVACASARDILPYTAEAQAYIRAWQHSDNCTDRNWVMSDHRAGIGSEIHVATAVLGWAINHNAIFVWPTKTQWINTAWCGSAQGFECAFVRVTNCLPTQLDPKRRLSTNPYMAQSAVPGRFANLTTWPYSLRYWWRAQGTHYLTEFNERFRAELEAMRRRYAPFAPLPCGSVCVYVRHGDKGGEMELLPWSRFRNALQLAREMLSLRQPALRCDVQHAPVFLMTDDHGVVYDAHKDIRGRVLFVNESVVGPLPHERGGNSSAEAKWENFKMSMLNLELCCEADAFVSQRQANFARLIDEHRLTRSARLGWPFIEVGAYDFGWK